jgi:hypothetical protein
MKWFALLPSPWSCWRYLLEDEKDIISFNLIMKLGERTRKMGFQSGYFTASALFTFCLTTNDDAR